MTNEQALYALVSGTGLTLTVDGGCEDESSFASNVTFFVDVNDPRIPTWAQIQAKFAELKAAEPILILREERNKKLAETDWWILRGNPTDDQLIYRQELRDLPKISEPKLDENGELTNVTWPEKPE